MKTTIESLQFADKPSNDQLKEVLVIFEDYYDIINDKVVEIFEKLMKVMFIPHNSYMESWKIIDDQLDIKYRVETFYRGEYETNYETELFPVKYLFNGFEDLYQLKLEEIEIERKAVAKRERERTLRNKKNELEKAKREYERLKKQFEQKE